MVASLSTSAQAWGPDGHHTLGATADALLSATRAGSQVRTLLGSITVEDAVFWADCAKGVNPISFVHKGAGECSDSAPFEKTAGEADMVAFYHVESFAPLEFELKSSKTWSATPLRVRGVDGWTKKAGIMLRAGPHSSLKEPGEAEKSTPTDIDDSWNREVQ
jgi:hypothetical protein